MFYNKGELTYLECIKIKKQGFIVPLFSCKRKNGCNQYKNKTGRFRCPGRLLDNNLTDGVSHITGKYCGWNPISKILDGESTIAINITEPEKFTPQHIVPII